MDNKLQHLDSEIQKTSGDPALYMERAQLFFNLHKYRKCVEDCEQAIILEKDNASAYSLLGYAYCRLHEFNKAFDAAENALSIDPGNPLAYCVRGNCYTNNLLEHGKALADYNKAIELDESFAMAYNNRANVYCYRLKEYDKALADYNKAIELDESFAIAYNNRANFYYYQLKEYDKALADYNKAIELDKIDARAYCTRGKFYSDQLKEYDKALDDYNKAIESEENSAIVYHMRGDLYYYQLKEYDKALDDYNKSKELYLNEGNFSNMRIVEGKITEIRGLLSKSNTKNQKIKMMMEKIDESSIEDSIRETKKEFKQFISERKAPLSSDISEFIVLRRWNSYTPIIAENNRISKGGGYFFKTPDCGIVIDPGFNFIDNFKAVGNQFHEIDHILITHAHNDHTTDLESILTLLHQYNEMILGDFDAPDDNTIMHEVISEQKVNVTENDRDRIEDLAKKRFSTSSRRKRIRIYMTTSTYKKYSPMLDLYETSDYDIVLIRANDKLPIIHPSLSKTDYAKDLEITAIHAKHNDLLSDRDSLGFILHYKEFVLVYTGDTGFNAEIEKQYKNIYKKYSRYNIVLLAHLGGFKEYEKKFDASIDIDENYQFFYKNHLGRLGLAKLIEIIKPTICIISEFGEEFRKTRLELTQIFQDVYKNDTFFIPADIGLCLNTNNQINLIDKIDYEMLKVQSNFYDYSNTSVCEHKPNASLQYYKKSNVNEADLREFLSSLSTRYN